MKFWTSRNGASGSIPCADMYNQVSLTRQCHFVHRHGSGWLAFYISLVWFSVMMEVGCWHVMAFVRSGRLVMSRRGFCGCAMRMRYIEVCLSIFVTISFLDDMEK